ncbi:MAG: hypothetical protein AAF721_23200 [Myxococcota bacterium]
MHPGTNDFTDHHQRYERALLQLSARLNARQFAHRLVSDAGRGGDDLAVVAESQGGLVELVVRRQSAEAGVVGLFASDLGSLERWAAAIRGSTAEARRLARAQRGLIATVEAVTAALCQRFEGLRSGFPGHALEALRTAAPEATPLIGLTAWARRAPVVARRSTLLERARCTPAYAASVPAGAHRRAARWAPADGAFHLPPGAHRALRDRRGTMTLGALAAAAIAAAPHHDDDGRSGSAFDPVDGAELSCDLFDALSWDAPLDACEFVDCGGLDCFSASPDCVPLDCGGCG